MKDKLFPYTIKERYAVLNDGRCCAQVSDHTGFHFFRCDKKEKEKIDGVGLCGIHSRMVKKWRET